MSNIHASRKLIALALCAALAASSCASQGATSSQEQQPAEQSSSASEEKEIVQLRYLTNQDNFDPLQDYTYELIKEKLGVEIIPEMGDDEEDKLNLILASGQEYDLIKVPSRQLLTKYIKNNAIQPLSDLINQYGDNLQKYIRPETWDMVTSNGEIYAIPEEAVADVEWGIGVREDWVNALGMELPTTPDEFYELLKAFKEQDPGNVGAENVIPFTARGVDAKGAVGINGLAQAFGLAANPSTDFIELDGKLVSCIEAPGMKDYLAYLNKLYAEGLLDQDFPANKDANVTEKLSAGATGAAAMTPWESAAQRSIAEMTGGEGKMVFLEPLKDAEGNQSIQNRGGVLAYTVVPKSSQKAAEVVKYCNAFLDDENYLSIVLGEENETYTVKDGSYYPILPESDKLNKGRWFYPTNSQELYTPLFSARAHKETEMGELYDDITAKCMSFNYNRLNNILPILPEAEKYESKLSALAEEKMMKMILDQGELDKFDEFVAQWKAEGGDELTNAYNAWYAEQG